MTGNEDFLTASLHHGNLQVDTSEPRQSSTLLSVAVVRGTETNKRSIS